MKNVKVIKKAAIFLMVFVLAFSSLSAAAAPSFLKCFLKITRIASKYDSLHGFICSSEHENDCLSSR